MNVPLVATALIATLLGGCVAHTSGPQISPTVPVSAFIGKAPEGAVRLLTWNATGDALLRFTLSTTENAHCDVIVGASFRYDAREQNATMFVLQSHGAAFTYGATESSHVGAVVLTESKSNYTRAEQLQVVGPYRAETTITIGVHHLTWWPNDIVPGGTLRVSVSCQSPYEISDARGARSVILLRAGNFHGGTATDTPAGPVAVGDEWHGNVVGAHAAIVGIVIGYAALINMTATTNQGTFQWQYLHQNNVDDLLDHELAPGPLALKLNFLLGTLALAIGDLEPLVVPENLLPSQ